MERYRSERSERWTNFEHRPDDIVISTRSKCGTTWMQTICLLLVHGTPLPAPVSLLSPWLDWDVEAGDVVRARLAAQRHRRVIKTHTPLDGLPLDPDVRYIVVGRHPLDVAEGELAQMLRARILCCMARHGGRGWYGSSLARQA